jgi:hypothetical protein
MTVAVRVRPADMWKVTGSAGDTRSRRRVPGSGVDVAPIEDTLQYPREALDAPEFRNELARCKR